MRLLKFEGFTLVVEPEALLIKSIRDLWNRDKTKNKWKALLELGYIYFLVDPRSTYSYITDEKERAATIIKEEGMPDKWKPDKVVLEALESYKRSVTTVSSALLEDTKKTVDKLRKYLLEIDFTELDDKDKPRYPPNVVTSTIKQIPELAKSLVETEKIVAQEITENSRMRGNKEKHIFEDGI